jgi:hypothetical protein
MREFFLSLLYVRLSLQPRPGSLLLLFISPSSCLFSAPPPKFFVSSSTLATYTTLRKLLDVDPSEEKLVWFGYFCSVQFNQIRLGA